MEESGHWIVKVTDGGRFIHLEDGSVWEIEPIDRVETCIWLPVADITIIDDEKLYNKEDRKTVGARRVKRAP